MRYPVEKDYTWPLKIASYDAGRDRRLRLSNQLKLQEEAGERHLGGAGLGYRELYRHGMIFVMTKTASVIHRSPQLGEEVRLRTWHRDGRGAQFFRCYTFLDAQDRPLIESVSAFALVDPVSHKLLRPAVFEQFGVERQPERTNGCPDPGRLHLPEGLEPAGRRRIYWSDTDYNGHLNNTRYADILCDFVPGGLYGKRVTGFTIVYQHEALEGDELEIRACAQDNTAWVSVAHPRGACFEACLTYEPEE